MKMNTSAPRPNVNLRALRVLALAGKAVLTFRNLESGTHFTARIYQKRDRADRKVKLPAYNVQLSILQDGVQRYRYAGMIFTDKPQIRMWVDRKLSESNANDVKLVAIFRWLVSAIENPEILRGRVGLFHEGHCCECGLPLTHPESIHTGLGPVCLKRMRENEKNIDILEFFQQAD